MSRAKTPKTFDCVEFKRKAQAEIYAEIKDLVPAEQIDYFRSRARSDPLGEWMESVRNAQSGRSKSEDV